MITEELKATRQAFGEALFELMKRNEKVVALTADLGESLRMLSIREEMPERFIDVGVAEANMAGLAAGLAMEGYVPVAGTFAVFMTRAYDHIRVQVCQNNLPVVLVGSHGGVSNARDGGSAHALEDIAYMRTLPNMTIVYPADANETREALFAVVDKGGPAYLRLYREPTRVLSDQKEFTLGKAKIYKEGTDLTLIATGPQTINALWVADDFEKEGLSVEVLGMSTLQPLDKEAIAASARKTGKVVTVEDHSVNGGLGSAVAEVLGEFCPAMMKRVGVNQFGESGAYAELIEKLGIDNAGIKRAIKSL